MKSTFIAIFGIIALMLAWVMIQNLWRSSFSEEIDDEDVLAVRGQCGNCGCSITCSDKRERTPNHLINELSN